MERRGRGRGSEVGMRGGGKVRSGNRERCRGRKMEGGGMGWRIT